MRSNEARVQILEEQPDEKAMEARIARIESDVAHIQKNLATVQVDVSKLRDGRHRRGEGVSLAPGQSEAMRSFAEDRGIPGRPPLKHPPQCL